MIWTYEGLAKILSQLHDGGVASVSASVFVTAGNSCQRVYHRLTHGLGFRQHRSQTRRRQWRLIDRVDSPTAGVLPDTTRLHLVRCIDFDVIGLRQPLYVLLRWLYIPEDNIDFCIRLHADTRDTDRYRPQPLAQTCRGWASYDSKRMTHNY